MKRDDPSEWGTALERVDAAWQWIEAGLCTGVLLAEIAALTIWVSLKGLSADYAPGGDASGAVFRCVATAAAFGVSAHLVTRGRSERLHKAVTTIGIALGLVAGRCLVHVGVGYASNVLNWLQNASSLMLIGGLRGLVTRLTLWLALLGASLATSRGKHIHVDLVLRYLPARLRVPSAIASQLAAAVVCAAGVVGFLDYIAIASYRAPAVEPCPAAPTTSCDTSVREKLAVVERNVSADFFLLGRQLSLDVRSLPEVIAGVPYDGWMTAEAWNAWLDGAAWKSHFDAGAVDALRMAPAASATKALRMPQVAVPGTGEQARGLLVRELTFVFPVGLFALALKFLLRIALLWAGRVRTDPEAALDDEQLVRARGRPDAGAPKPVSVRGT